MPNAAAWGATEDGLAQALVSIYGNALRYCPERGRWLVWESYRWRWDEAERHRELIRSLARDLPATGTWHRFRNHALSARGVSGIARLARTDAGITVNLADLDNRPYELNTPSGIINLRTGALQPPDPLRLHTRSTAVPVDFSRTSDLWQRFLTDTFGDDVELAKYVQRLLGLSAVGTVLEQLLPFAHGLGANGKSTLMETAMHVLGRGPNGYAISGSSELLMVRRHHEHPAELASLAGARLVVCSELDEGQRFAEARVKLLTGRDSIPARFMRRDWFTFQPTHTLWLMGNHTPDTRAGGPAFWRRVRLLPFARTVSPDRQDRRLGERLTEEAPAILAWIVAGAVAYHRAGLAEPASVRAATDAYERDQDTVGRFVEECCHLAAGQPHLKIATTALREAYEQWCTDASETPVSAKRLTQQLRERHHVQDARGSKGRRFYHGIALNVEPV